MDAVAGDVCARSGFTVLTADVAMILCALL